MNNLKFKASAYDWLFILLFFVQSAVAQTQTLVTIKPDFDSQSDEHTSILKVELKNNQTVITFSYVERGQKSIKLGDYGIEVVRIPHSISINPESYLRVGKKTYKFIKATGLPLLPKETSIEVGEKIRFTVYFDRLAAGEEVFDFIEGKNSEYDSRHYWNFYGVHIINPAPDKKLTPKITSQKPVLVDKIILKGKLIDAKTNLPILGKIVYFGETITKQDSIKTTKTGEFRIELKPDNYTFKASAKGYENSEEEYDLSSIKKGIFTKNISLNSAKINAPIKTDTTSSDSTKITSPILVEQNKFRLDKVYFNVGEANLLPESYLQLDGLLKMMKENSKMIIEVEGHTDNVGDETLNKKLSLDRAFSVREYLIKKGIVGNRIKFKGYGDSKPISSNDSEEGRKQNRRVEFLILEQ